jgi:hypothetical protein
MFTFNYKYNYFLINRQQIKKNGQFNYLGWMISDDDDDIYAVEVQAKKARITWGRICKIVKKKTNSNPHMMGKFYLTILQSI